VLTLKFCRHDYNSHLLAKNVKVQSFSERHPKLCEDFGNAFATWVMDVQDVIDGNSLNVDEKPATPIIAIQKGEGGIPLLPPPINGRGGYELLETKRTIIRFYINKHYRELLLILACFILTLGIHNL